MGRHIAVILAVLATSATMTTPASPRDNSYATAVRTVDGAGREHYRSSRHYGGDAVAYRRGHGHYNGSRTARRHGSFDYVSRPIERTSPSFYYRGTGIYANAAGPSFVVVGVQGPENAGAEGWAEPAERIIDVETARLDRKPIGPSGIAVHYVGSAKIIRIAPGYGERTAALEEPRRRATAPVPSAAAPAALPRPYQPPRTAQPQVAAPAVPLPEQAPARSEQASEVAPPTLPAESAGTAPSGESFEPWTDEWLRDCVARYENFDASLGTYTDADGRRRFCTGEPS